MKAPLELPEIRSVLEDDVLVIMLNRPEKSNSINGTLARGLYALVDWSEQADEVRAVILHGAGSRVFCAGADLAEIAHGKSADQWVGDAGFAGFVRAERSKPWIAALNGSAYGGGTEIALACDLIVAAEDALMSLPEVTRGFIASAGGAFRLSRAMPPRLALEAMLTGRSVGMEAAVRWGLVNRVCRADCVLKEARALARAITVNAPLAVRATLAIARRSVSPDEEKLWAFSDEARQSVLRSDDAKEGARAFLEKRPPVWRGR